MFPVVDQNTGRVKYTARSRAKVLSNADPDKKGRIKVQHLLLGESEWIPYLTAPNSFFIPKKDDIVYVECDAGYETHMIAWGNIQKGFEDGSLKDLPEVFQRMTPSNQGFYTPGKHLIEIDDGSDKTGKDKGIRITSSAKNKIHIKDEKMDKSITLTGENEAEFKLDSTNDAITAKVKFGDSLELSKANGFQISTPAGGGTSLSMKGGKIDLECNMAATFTSKSDSLTFKAKSQISLISETAALNIKADAGQIKLEGSGGAALKLEQGKVALGGAAGELLDLCEQHLSALIDNASSIALTSVGPAQLSPAVVTALTQVKTILGTIKGSL